MKQPIIFYDLETGGLEESHPIIQLAAIVVQDWKELRTFERKLEFDIAACDREALEMNSYDADLWARHAVPDHEVLRSFMRNIIEPYRWMPMTSKHGNTWLNAFGAGHNTHFDRDRIGWLAQSHSEFLALDFRGLDTMQLALWRMMKTGETLPKDFKLTTLCNHYGIGTAGAHDALTDVRLSIALAKRCLEGN